MRKELVKKDSEEFKGINLTFCENPLSPIDEAIYAAKGELKKSNFYTEPYSMKLKEAISDFIDVPIGNIHINAGSELIIRQLFSIFGQRVHLLVPTWELFEKIAKKKTFSYLREEREFSMDLSELEIPKQTTLMPVVNPNNPTGGLFNIKDSLELIEDNPKTMFLIDEAFIEFGGKTAVDLPEQYNNVIVTRTFSKGFGLAGFRVGYAILPKKQAKYMNEHNDPVPLTRASEAAAIAVLKNMDKIMKRVEKLKKWAKELAQHLEYVGIRTYPTETYFFLAKINVNREKFVNELKKRAIRVKPAKQEGLGKKFIKFTTSTQENNEIVIQAIKEILGD